MESSVTAFLEKTEALSSRLDSCTWEELSLFVQERGELVSLVHEGKLELTSKVSDELARILFYDEQISKQMKKYKQEAAQWLVQRQTSKIQRNAYELNYAPDSILMDKKK
ncbi:hypothetical protein Q5741_09080 [Paenibacillus sp. JX-17]|uniref:Flagellar protein FliT n=1 Tax=Paenibacillus lacisoli TaxID=3064525 RepID=A0ABT9CBD6_9BACL|nr:hypothetical protein [Paenibacillus sp. JX-17]MDO7906572.1 hypothetical protein [Paenibacillus sp. JX-17]